MCVSLGSCQLEMAVIRSVKTNGILEGYLCAGTGIREGGVERSQLMFVGV